MLERPEKRAKPKMLSADLIVQNAAIHTMDLRCPSAQAIAVVGERIAALGSTEEIHALAGAVTRIVDADGATVLPGFNDAHVHFLAGGFSLSRVDLRHCCSMAEFARSLGEYASQAPAGSWIEGGDWDHENWAKASDVTTALPTRWLVDPVTSEHPILLTRLDGHMALANSLALRLAGVTRHTRDVPGGVIVRDVKTGEPTGLLKDAAQSLVERILPAKTIAQKKVAALAATRHAASLGVTSLTDVSADADISLYQELIRSNQLKTRIYAARSIANYEMLLKAGVRAGFGNDLLRIGAVKGFADGSLGSSTALFFEDYADQPANRGLLFEQMFPEGAMLQRAIAADCAGIQILIHAIGDEANSRILDLFQEVEAVNGPRDRRFRIEHAQHLRLDDIVRFGRQRIIASMQPYHAADDGRWCERRLGRSRCQTAYAFRSLLDTGALLAFGSDWTVAPLNPLLGIKAAVTRQTLDGRHPNGWIPEQKLTLDEAIHAYTVGSAYAEFAEAAKGSLSVGKFADMVVLDRDIHQLDPATLDRAAVTRTILGGRVIYEAQ